MYAFIEGRVCEKTTNSLVLEAGGVGYQLNCSMTTLAGGAAGGRNHALLYLPVRPRGRDGALRLRYPRRNSRIFLSLTGVTGVGAKTALALLGSYAPAAILNLAILLGDVDCPHPRPRHRQKDGAANRPGTQG